MALKYYDIACYSEESKESNAKKHGEEGEIRNKNE
jgi:hypothetical protein